MIARWAIMKFLKSCVEFPRAVLASLLLLVIACILQAFDVTFLKLPVQWLWVAVIPLLVALVHEGYIGKVVVGGIEIEPKLRRLPYYPPADRSLVGVEVEGCGEVPPGFPMPSGVPGLPWTDERGKKYTENHDLFVLHVYEPSKERRNYFDVTLFLIRHIKGMVPNQKEGFREVAQVEFFFGKSWRNQVFVAPNKGGVIGIRTSAWGSFLATCQISFNDGSSPVVLHRYIDFEMAGVKSEAKS